jgi:hypothetical protein
MPDMSRWNADAPGNTSAWWIQQACVVPDEARAEFNEFVAALNTYTLAATAANLNAVCARVSALIEAIPNSSARMPSRERFASLLPGGRLRDMMHSSTAKGKGESDNLVLGLKNLVATLGGHIVPKAYEV